jgi:hypothetical protein
MQILQVIAAIVSILLGASQVAKEVRPMLQPQYSYRCEDAQFRYYSDPSGRYWCRVDARGMYQYAENPSFVR